MLLGAVGLCTANYVIVLLGTPADLRSLAVQYLNIYFWGLPVMAVFNLCSAALRSVGDTQNSLYFLSVAGICNLGLNILFVAVLGIGVVGIALGTVLSQVLACVLMLRLLTKGYRSILFRVGDLKLTGRHVREILRIGLPAGVQSVIFSVSNMMIQAGYNSFGSDVVAGNAAGGTIEQFVFATMAAYGQAAVSFVGQNIGAGNLRRVRDSLGVCLMWCNLFGLISG